MINNKNQYFKNKVIVITGAGTGYGRELSIALLSYEANVILVGRRIKKLQETVKLANYSNNAMTVICDITKINQIKNLKKQIQNRYDNIDILINCAGIPAHGNASLSKISEQRWDDMIDTNLKAQWLISRELFSLMKNKIARILFFTSGAGWSDTSGHGLYNISKTALNSLTISMAKEYETLYPSQNISINAINPGEAKTQMNTKSNIKASIICDMVLKILSTTKNIPNGKFFHRDGKYIRFCDSKEYNYELE